MKTHAHEALRDLMALTGAVLLLASCGWEVDAQSAAQGLGRTQPDGGDYIVTTSMTGYPKGGVHFPAELWGECNDCGDQGCTRSKGDGWHDCICHEEGEACWPQPMIALPDGGIQPSEFCAYQGQQCECDDGLGPIYACECEGGGDQCSCRVPREVPLFDYELQCENTDHP